MSDAESSNLGIIRSAVSGEELVRLAADDLPVLAETQGTSVLALKRVLAKRINMSRFRQRLLTDDGELLHDDTLLSPPLNLVKLELLKPDEDRDAAFLDACAENRVAEVENRLCGPQDPNTVSIITTHDDDDGDEEHLTAFSVAAQHGHPEVVSLLLEADADTDMCGNIYGETPLLSAAFNGDLDIVWLLLEAGADKEKFDIDGQTALHNASEEGHLETVRLLLESGANRDPCDNPFASCIWRWPFGSGAASARFRCKKRAMRQPRQNTFTFVCKKWPFGSSVFVAGSSVFVAGGRCKQRSMRQQRQNTFAFCIWRWPFGNGAASARVSCNNDPCDNQGGTPLHLFAKVAEVVCLLLEAGANKEKFDSEGKTALHRDSMLGNLELAQLLLELGADKDKEDNQQATPLHWAAKFGRFEVVDLLLKQTDGGVAREAPPELASRDLLGKSIECGWRSHYFPLKKRQELRSCSLRSYMSVIVARCGIRAEDPWLHVWEFPFCMPLQCLFSWNLNMHWICNEFETILCCTAA